jgi:hypothetical protein
LAGVVLEVEQGSYRVDLETQGPGVAEEGKAPKVGRFVEPEIAVGSWRLGASLRRSRALPRRSELIGA